MDALKQAVIIAAASMGAMGWVFYSIWYDRYIGSRPSAEDG